eukprot:Sdes_comp20482_c0_seq1m14816
MTKISVTSWDRILDVHLKGTFLMTQAVSQKMISTSPPALPPSRSITNISSIVGKTGSRGLAHYACAKSGIVGFTKTVSQELGFKYVYQPILCFEALHSALSLFILCPQLICLDTESAVTAFSPGSLIHP